jgi:GMP reductase
MQIVNELKLDFSDVLIKPKRSTLSSRSQVNLTRSIEFLNKTSWEGTPIVAANMDTVGSIAAAIELAKYNMITCLHKHYESEVLIDFFSYVKKSNLQNYVAYSTGIRSEDIEKLNYVISKAGSDAIKILCIDVANGYTQKFVDAVRKIRDKYPDKIIIAGNVVTPEITEQLILSGADIVKVGIGSGSACTTRIKTGVGCPQLSAVIECADAAHGIGGRIMSDGGCTVPGDISKAFCGGADFVMLGGMLAGHTENLITDAEGEPVFYGMSSFEAMNKYEGSIRKYRTSEGRVVRMRHKGNISSTLEDILGGVRSTCTYIGARNIKEMPKCATFFRVNNQLNRIYETSTIKS